MPAQTRSDEAFIAELLRQHAFRLGVASLAEATADVLLIARALIDATIRRGCDSPTRAAKSIAGAICGYLQIQPEEP